MKKNIRLMVLAVGLVLVLILAGCGGSKQSAEQKSTAASEQTAGQSSTSQPADNASAPPATQNSAPAQEQSAGQPAAGQQAAAPAGQGTTGQSAAPGQPATSPAQAPSTQQPAAKPAAPTQQPAAKPATSAQQPAAQPAAAKTPFEDYIYSMPARFLPDAAKGVTAVYQFNLTDGSKGKYYAIIKDGKCTVGKGEAPAAPTLVINTGEQLWVDIATDKVNGKIAYLTKKFTIQGSTDDLQDMKTYFKPYQGQ
ncbi:MAG: SCP2 sterol-binding domain-containing protein [Desulfurispora sp.]|uniref:SCP2 sterol-binding domain-containing protein n=1 Tax=Desulfurispora sp. TaxID=3014275 RepID=UPI00404969E5